MTGQEDYTVRLREVFQGPMDLLLHLVREQEVEIHEIEIHRVIDGYFAYLKELEDLDIELAGDFLVIAATLMSIKSRSLLPRDEVEIEDELDPEDELIQRLIEYRRFKSTAEDLDVRRVERANMHERGYQREVHDNEPERTLDLGELTAWDLLATFSRLMRETLANRTHHVRGESRPLRWFVRQLGLAVQSRPRQTLRELLLALEEEPTKEGLIGAFCALLELMRLGVVSATQESKDAEIEVLGSPDLGDDLDSLIGASRLMDEEEPSEEPPEDAGADARGESDAAEPTAQAPDTENETLDSMEISAERATD